MFAGYSLSDVLQGHMRYSLVRRPICDTRFDDFREIWDKYYCVFMFIKDQVKNLYV